MLSPSLKNISNICDMDCFSVGNFCRIGKNCRVKIFPPAGTQAISDPACSLQPSVFTAVKSWSLKAAG
jgi:hypothetical protein